MGNGKLKKFFKDNNIGKGLVSVALGFANATPLAPFVPSIKGAIGGLAGKDKNDIVAWAAFAVTIGTIVLMFMGRTEEAQILNDMK